MGLSSPGTSQLPPSDNPWGDGVSGGFDASPVGTPGVDAWSDVLNVKDIPESDMTMRMRIPLTIVLLTYDLGVQSAIRLITCDRLDQQDKLGIGTAPRSTA